MIVRRYSVLLLLCSVFLAPIANAASNVVISQVYGGGGSGTAGTAYTNDYVEIFNTGDSPASIGGFSLQYGSSTGQFGSSSGNIFAFPAGTSLGAGKYLTVKLGTAGTAGSAFTSDFTLTTLNMAAGSGKVALVTSNAALGCGATATPCALPDPRILDVVSYGASNNGEGGTSVNNGTGLDSTKGAIRKSAGCTDTNNNSADFLVATVATGLVPRTSAAPANLCPVVINNSPTITTPANPIATVAQDSAAFTVSLAGNDDGGIYVWSATPGSGVSSVSVTGGQSTGTVTYTVTIQAGFNGTATFTASLSDTVNPAATRSVNITVTPIVVNNNPPTISLPANPITTVAQDAPSFAVNLSGSDDNAVYNWSAASGTGVSAVSVTGGQGTANATFTVTLQIGFSGTATFTSSLSDNVNAPASQIVNIAVTPAPPPPLDHVVISQIYGGGGNTGATYRNDYVELYNPSLVAFDLGGWTVQYGSATGSTWQAQPLGGVIRPGEYYLITLATGGAVGALVPEANVTGDINMSGTAGKVALVSSGDALSGCVVSEPSLVDLVGYGGTANCREGATSAPAPSNTTSIFRKNGGFTDTNVNGADFVTGAPNPRRTTPIVEIGPYVLSTDPRKNNTIAPRDASINVTFTEAVEVVGAWYDISCASTGLHNDATVAGGGRFWIITPNTNFLSGEQCRVTIFRNSVHDQDLDDSAPDTDTLRADYVWDFTTSTGAAPAYAPSVHLTMGNPSAATPDVFVPNNFLMEKPEYTLSYNRDRGTPNWVSWHLASEWIGTLQREDTFRPDPAVPSNWYRVLHTDYFGSGFDRGHMVPNADRDPETSVPINQATFLMSNMVPQSPDNNQGPWANMENYLRTLLPANELYIVAGGAGVGGTGSSGFRTTIANGRVTVPAQTWKVALVLPKADGNDVSRVTAAARTIAVIMPNVQGIFTVDWLKNYVVSVDQVEALTGYDFFSNVSDAVENSIEAGVNGVNPPGVENQSVSLREDSVRAFTLEAVSANSNPLTYSIVTAPAHGTLSGSGASQTFTPAPDFNGTDTFTFRVSEGSLTSNTATVTVTVLEVNDAPSAAGDSKSTNEDVALSFPAAGLIANDTPGPANESTQTLTVTAVSALAETHGTVTLAGGQITYVPAANYNGPASFTYQACDNGITAGLSDSLCATSTVSMVVNSINDAPTVSIAGLSTTTEGSVVTATATAADVDAAESFTFAWTVTKNGSPFAAAAGNPFSFTPDDNGTYAVSIVVMDAHGGSGAASTTVAATNVAPVIGTVSGPTAAVQLGSSASISVGYSDAGTADTHTASFTWDDGSSSTGNCTAGLCTASHTFAGAGVYGVGITISDDDGASASTSFNFIVVFDSNNAKVTGGGWIDSPAGASVSNPSMAGKATFTIDSKYQKGQTTPSGNTKLKADGLDFDSTSYDWLVVAGPRAQYKGAGTVNGRSGFGFLLTVIDGDVTGGGRIDKYRIRIWELASGATVYDNVMGGSDDIDLAAPQQIGNGSIVIHTSN